MILFYLLAAHALCDYPLQGDFLAKGKNHKHPLPGIPYYQCLLAHAIIHGGAVALITGNIYLGLAEFVIHTAIDYGKCQELYSFNTDQFFHIACKLIWVYILKLI